MQTEIRQTSFWQITTDDGVTYYPFPDFTGKEAASYHDIDVEDCSEAELMAGDHPAVGFHSGYLARLSAPGYLDCTEWTAHETKQQAIEHLNEMYGLLRGEEA